MVGQEAREQMELGTAVAQHTLGQGFDTAQETAAAQRAQGQGSDIVLEVVAAAALGLGKVAVHFTVFCSSGSGDDYIVGSGSGDGCSSGTGGCCSTETVGFGRAADWEPGAGFGQGAD